MARIIHDIRNPLGSMELMASLLQKELAGDKEKENILNHILFSIKNIDNILNNLLHYTRSPVPRFKMISLKQITDKAIYVLSYQIEKHNISILTDIQDNLFLWADETLMEQVFINIMLNAIQAMREGGAIQIKAISRDQNMEIYISDNGPGISPENIKRIFDPFFTTKDKGTGLGLTIAHNIIHAHDGEISVTSYPGNGTTFTIRISTGRRVKVETSDTSCRR